MLLTPQPSLVEQAYEVMLGEIADGTLAPNTHLIQEDLAARYDVSRHPIQQALLLLKNDGIVRDAGRRGLIVAPLDVKMMHDRYQVRATLDALAARLAAERCAASPEVAADLRRHGDGIIKAGLQAVEDGGIKGMIAHDIAFHAFIYAASGNPMIAPTAEIHWRFLRRVMGEILRHSAPPPTIWRQHREILAAIVAGEAADAETRILGHISDAANRLAANSATMNDQEPASERRRTGRINRNRPA